MNRRTQRAIELSATAFLLVRSQGSIVERDARTRDIAILWTQPGGVLSARVFTRGSRVYLEIWTAMRMLAVSRVTGAADYEVEEYTRGSWEKHLLRLAFEGARQLRSATVH